MSTAQPRLRSALKELKCPNCGAPVQQFTPDAQTIVCASCGSFIALDMEGATLAGKGRKLPPPSVPIEIGSTARFQDTDFFVMGRVAYGGWDDEDSWTWDEWLLGGADGRLLWLSYYPEEGEGFTLYTKLRVREPFDAKTSDMLPTGSGGKVRVHERYPAKILGAQGELTWRAKAGDTLYMAEAYGNGKRYSVQQTPEELEIHEGVALTEQEVAAAFNNPEWIKSLSQQAGQVRMVTIIGLIFLVFALWGCGAAVWASTTGEPVVSQSVTLSRANPIATIPVEFNQAGRASIVAVQAQGALPLPSSIDIDVSIDSPDGMENDLFTLELWRESGTDDEGYWEEAQASASDMFVPFQVGTHTLEVALGEGNLDTINVSVDVRRNHVLPTWFIIYAVVVGIVGVLILAFRYRKSIHRMAQSASDDE